jgi:hypothetical protein
MRRPGSSDDIALDLLSPTRFARHFGGVLATHLDLPPPPPSVSRESEKLFLKFVMKHILRFGAGNLLILVPRRAPNCGGLPKKKPGLKRRGGVGRSSTRRTPDLGGRECTERTTKTRLGRPERSSHLHHAQRCEGILSFSPFLPSLFSLLRRRRRRRRLPGSAAPSSLARRRSGFHRSVIRGCVLTLHHRVARHVHLGLHLERTHPPFTTRHLLRTPLGPPPPRSRPPSPALTLPH